MLVFSLGLLSDEEISREGLLSKERERKTEKAAPRAAALLEERFATLSKVERNKARQELDKLATAVSRRAPGKVR
jgi:hypothetical protein